MNPFRLSILLCVLALLPTTAAANGPPPARERSAPPEQPASPPHYAQYASPPRTPAPVRDNPRSARAPVPGGAKTCYVGGCSGPGLL